LRRAFEAGEKAGVNAGTLRSPDQFTETVHDEKIRITYVQHTKAGAVVPTTGTARSVFEWTAPSTSGTVVFHVAGNASNRDASPLGDFIYTGMGRSQSSDP
jgi:hypothetical protein